MERRVWINYVTFSRDLEWLKFSIQSLNKYAKGFDGVTIVVPVQDLDKFLPFEKMGDRILVKTFMEYPGKGFVHHLAMKCYADVFSPAATHVLHMDPDCLFSCPVTPDDYFVDGKPVLVIEPYEAILKALHHPRYHWKSVTEEALKFACDYETMCRHPAVHPRETYRGLRDYMERVHEVPFYDWVIKQKNQFPQGFGEFNTLGAWALKFSPEKYHFIDRGYDGEMRDPIPKVTQMWSYTGVNNPENQAKIRAILA